MDGDDIAEETAGKSPEEAETEQKTTLLEFEDSVEIETTKDDLWSTISDPEVLARCVPHADDIERLSERKYRIEMTRGIGDLNISLSGDIELVELNPPEWTVADGSAYDPRTHSTFDGVAAMELTEIDDGTVRLDYKSDLTFTGGVASLGTRILRRIFNSDVEAYFENIKAEVENTP